ncbi:MAG: cobyrinate a,c-diamide synthase [Synergistaceae bacterium]
MAKTVKNPPRILIAATQSGSGKTTITCGILALLKKRGLKVQGYKTGPDYIDPTYLSIAAGQQVHNLDTWLLDKETMTSLFAKHASKSDITVVEGVMGLYDGGKNGISSTAEISKLLKIPVILVIDVKAMGESAAAIALGFKEYDKNVNLAGVILNKVGSEKHKEMICEALEKLNIKVYGVIHRNPEMAITERHLGLLPAQENDNKKQIEIICNSVEKSIDIEGLIALSKTTQSIEAEEHKTTNEKKIKLAVAKDEAFSFYYAESQAELENAGAEITYFSPLHDKKLPQADGIIFGGGFPEMFAKQLSENIEMKNEIINATNKNIPIIAECGGFMYLTKSIANFDGETFQMCGIIPAISFMTNKLKRMGYVKAESLNDNLLTTKGKVMNGHEFHFSAITPDNEKTFPYAYEFTGNCGVGEKYKGGYAKDNIIASYLHIHFAGNKEAVKRFIEKCEKNKTK